MGLHDMRQQWTDGFSRGGIDAELALIPDEQIEFDATNLPDPLAKAQWGGFMRILRAAMPDISFNRAPDGDTKNALDDTRTGTLTGTLTLSPMGMQDFAPTGKPVRLPTDTCVFTITDDQITLIDVGSGPGAGLGGTLAQLGVA